MERHHRGHTMVRPDARDTLSRTDKPVLWTSMHGGHPLAVLGTINIRDCDGERDYEWYGLPLNLYWLTRQLVPFSRVFDVDIQVCIGEGGRRGSTAYCS